MREIKIKSHKKSFLGFLEVEILQKKMTNDYQKTNKFPLLVKRLYNFCY